MKNSQFNGRKINFQNGDATSNDVQRFLLKTRTELQEIQCWIHKIEVEYTKSNRKFKLDCFILTEIELVIAVKADCQVASSNKHGASIEMSSSMACHGLLKITAYVNGRKWSVRWYASIAGLNERFSLFCVFAIAFLFMLVCAPSSRRCAQHEPREMKDLKKATTSHLSQRLR